eukprot:TRINITY_DN3872_c0_g1_i2.p1 TRINITY_DN3872_c0_g1~~TRINITY_DN3872_c0_g1_i2.p1  ORF type:complete len:445 (-),score=97.18 TRINITY_DN3872_c0_g1_i2:134-1468(-)
MFNIMIVDIILIKIFVVDALILYFMKGFVMVYINTIVWDFINKVSEEINLSDITILDKFRKTVEDSNDPEEIIDYIIYISEELSSSNASKIAATYGYILAEKYFSNGEKILKDAKKNYLYIFMKSPSTTEIEKATIIKLLKELKEYYRDRNNLKKQILYTRCLAFEESSMGFYEYSVEHFEEMQQLLHMNKQYMEPEDQINWSRMLIFVGDYEKTLELSQNLRDSIKDGVVDKKYIGSILLNVVTVLYRKGDLNGATKILDEIEKEDTNINLLIWRARVCACNKDYERAIELLDELPDSYTKNSLKGEYQSKSRKDVQSLKILEKLYTIRHTFPTISHMFTNIRYSLALSRHGLYDAAEENYKEALAVFESLLKRSPNAEYLKNTKNKLDLCLALLLLGKGEKDQAIEVAINLKQDIESRFGVGNLWANDVNEFLDSVKNDKSN